MREQAVIADGHAKSGDEVETRHQTQLGPAHAAPPGVHDGPEKHAERHQDEDQVDDPLAEREGTKVLYRPSLGADRSLCGGIPLDGRRGRS